MIGEINSVESFKKFLNEKVRDRDRMMKKFDEAREINGLYSFLGSNSVAMQGAVVHGDWADRYLFQMDKSIEAIGEDAYIKHLHQVVIHRVKQSHHINPASRSTSLSSNINEDYEQLFFVEIFEKMDWE